MCHNMANVLPVGFICSHQSDDDMIVISVFGRKSDVEDTNLERKDFHS